MYFAIGLRQDFHYSHIAAFAAARVLHFIILTRLRGEAGGKSAAIHTAKGFSGKRAIEHQRFASRHYKFFIRLAEHHAGIGIHGVAALSGRHAHRKVADTARQAAGETGMTAAALFFWVSGLNG